MEGICDLQVFVSYKRIDGHFQIFFLVDIPVLNLFRDKINMITPSNMKTFIIQK